MIRDAVVNTIGEIVEAICSTPLHPERGGFLAVTSALANKATIPRTDSGGSNKIIGVYGHVRDSSSGVICDPWPVEKVVRFNLLSSTVYNGMSFYGYAITGNTIQHTRSNVVIEVCSYTRPTSFSGNIGIDDWHERGLVNGAVAHLAPKEGMFADLYAAANGAYQAHLTEIRSYGNQALYGQALAAPATV